MRLALSPQFVAGRGWFCILSPNILSITPSSYTILIFLSETLTAGDWTCSKVKQGECSFDTTDPVTFVWPTGVLGEGSGTKPGSLNYLGIPLPISSPGCCAKLFSKQLEYIELMTSGKH